MINAINPAVNLKSVRGANWHRNHGKKRQSSTSWNNQTLMLATHDIDEQDHDHPATCLKMSRSGSASSSFSTSSSS